MESPLGHFGSGAQGLQERSDSGGLPLGLSNTQGARGRPRFASSTSSASGGVFRLARIFWKPSEPGSVSACTSVPSQRTPRLPGHLSRGAGPVSCFLGRKPRSVGPFTSLRSHRHTLLLRRRRGRRDRENEKALLGGEAVRGQRTACSLPLQLRQRQTPGVLGSRGRKRHLLT